MVAIQTGCFKYSFISGVQNSFVRMKKLYLIFFNTIRSFRKVAENWFDKNLEMIFKVGNLFDFFSSINKSSEIRYKHIYRRYTINVYFVRVHETFEMNFKIYLFRSLVFSIFFFFSVFKRLTTGTVCFVSLNRRKNLINQPSR